MKLWVFTRIGMTTLNFLFFFSYFLVFGKDVKNPLRVNMPTLRTILQHKRHVQASHWDPNKLANFNGVF